MKFSKYLVFLLITYTLQLTTYVYADSIYTKDGKEIKGIVVEEYKDRVVLSTVEGEKTVAKADIRELYFDNEESNLIRLAEQARDRRDFARSFTYYNLALKKNPSSKAANDGLVYLQGYLFRKEEAEKLDDIKRRENIERYGTVIGLEKTQTSEEQFKDLTARLWTVIGLAMDIKNKFPEVTDVRLKSPAADAGIHKGDILAAIWGKLTGYMSLAEIMGTLLDKPSLEIKCTVDRALVARTDGATFTMEWEGLTVSGVKEGSPAFDSGLKQGDLVTAIKGTSTRYMPLAKALKLIKKAGDGQVNLILRREILIWRGE